MTDLYTWQAVCLILMVAVVAANYLHEKGPRR